MELFWIVLGAAMFGWGGYLVGTSIATARREMHTYVRTHHYVEPDI